MKASSHCIHCQGMDERVDNPVHHPSYEITTRCNLQCIYCYSNIAVKKGKAPASGYYGESEDVKAITISQFGEPLVAGVDEVVRVAKKLKDLFNARLDLQTNGILLRGKAIKKLERFFDIIMVSLDVSSRKKYFEITGFDGFEILMENLKALRDTSSKCIIRTIYMPGINDKDVLKIAEISNSLDMEMFLQPLSVYNPEIMKEHGLDMERNESIYEFIKISEKLEKIADLRVPGCFVVNIKRISEIYGKEAIKFIRRKSLASVPEIKRNFLFRL